MDKGLMIRLANYTEKEKLARSMAESLPWTYLGVKEETCRKHCNNPDFLVYIATVHNNYCGGMIIDPQGVAGSPYLKSIVVIPEARNLNIGTQLILFACARFSRHAPYLFLCVSAFNQHAKHLYEKLDFREVCQLHDYLKYGEVELLMVKKLSN